MSEKDLRRNHHYVPCGYLKRWADPEERVWAYRILVSHPRVPPWKLTSLRGVAYHSHLYTQVIGGHETDEFEKWLDREIEEPAQEPLCKATSDARLTPDDWERLIRFVAAQDVRTPARLEEEMRRWKAEMPDLLDKTLRDSVRGLEEAIRTEQRLPSAPRDPQDQEDRALPIKVTSIRRPGRKTGEIKAEITLGRDLWLWTIKHAVNHLSGALRDHKWTILKPPEGCSWFTTDSPVLRLNYSSPSSYDFRGGWGSPGTEIVIPLGPQHLLYTQIGKRPALLRGRRMPIAQASIVRRLIAEHAHRLVFSTEQDPDVPRLRPRTVDADLYRQEGEQWAKWHERQTAVDDE